MGGLPGEIFIDFDDLGTPLGSLFGDIWPPRVPLSVPRRVFCNPWLPYYRACCSRESLSRPPRSLFESPRSLLVWLSGVFHINNGGNRLPPKLLLNSTCICSRVFRVGSLQSRGIALRSGSRSQGSHISSILCSNFICIPASMMPGSWMNRGCAKRGPKILVCIYIYIYWSMYITCGF